MMKLLYLDPGSGSLLIQLLLAALLGAGVAIRVFWKKIKRLFKRTPEESEQEGSTPSDQPLDE